MGRVIVPGGPLQTLELAVALARIAFRRQLAHRAAAIGGLVTNAVFGAFLASVYIAVYAARGDAPIGSMGRDDALTYVWLGQALIVPTMVWGSWDIATSVRTGDVVADLLKPYSFFGYWLSRDLGRAAAGVLMRFIPTMLVGLAFYPLDVPEHPLRVAAFVVATAGAVAVSFTVRFCLNMVAFWWNDLQGIQSAQLAVVGFLSGFLMPIDFYPGWLRGVVNVLPFRGIVMTPVDVWLGNGSVIALLAAQLGWLVVGVVFSQWLFGRAVRRLVVQGG